MRYLALDPGDRRVGVAISDTLGMIARPLEVFVRGSRERDREHIRALIAEHKAECLVIGLPLNMDGSEGHQAAWVRSYASALQVAFDVPFVLWDERLTTYEAEGIARAQGRSVDKNWIDAVAAAVILQSYLDAQATPAVPPPTPDEERNPST
jgi:putative Holliday junction resolvase